VKTALHNERTPSALNQTDSYQSQTETKNRQRVNTIDTHQSDKDSSKAKDPHTVIDKYANLPFMPQKNEQSDRRDILLRSKEFNPLISFPLAGPSSVSEQKSADKPAKGKKQKIKPLKKSTVESYSR